MPVHSPAASVLFLAYNQASSVAQAAHSVLDQTGEPLEILLSDDASTDATFEVMQGVAASYRGPHQVLVRRNVINQGIGRHYNTLIELAHAELLITAAGDDVSEPGRMQALVDAWRAHGSRPDLITSHLSELSDGPSSGRVLEVDDLSAWHSVADWARRRPHVIGAAQAFTRRLHRHFGSYGSELAYEDQVNTLRAIALGGAITVPRPLVRYRTGGLSGSTRRHDAASMLAWARRRNRIHLALHAQWLADGATMGQFGLVEQAIAHEHRRELFMQRLLDAPGDAARWHVAWHTGDLPLGWRMRKALQLSCPALWAATRR